MGGMVTVNIDARQDWPVDLIIRIWQDAARKCWPWEADPHYISGAGVMVPAVCQVISELVDDIGAEVVLLGRGSVMDQVLDDRPSDIAWCDGSRLEQIGWWRGCLLVRMLHWRFPSTVRIAYADGTMMDCQSFPKNELWLLPLADARNGEASMLYRYVDTSLVP